MDKAQEAILKFNKHYEDNPKANPLGVRAGHFVSVNGRDIYKVLRFTIITGKPAVSVNLIMTEEGERIRKMKPLVIELRKVKPIIARLGEIKKKIEHYKWFEQLIMVNVNDPEYYKMFDAFGDKINI